MEAVGIYRPSSDVDAYGNPVDGELELIDTLYLLVSPQVTDEPKLLGRSALVTNYNVYNQEKPSGILPDDILLVRGEMTPVDGRIAHWPNRDGSFNGEQIQVKLVAG
jgi:hypothetical protein